MFPIDLYSLGVLFLILVAYYIFSSKSIRVILVLGASLTFYLYFFGRAFWILLVIAAVFYAVAFLIKKTDSTGKKSVFILVIVTITLIFLFLRYRDFLFDFLSRHLSLSSNITNSIILPVGLSFFIFKGLSYLIDLYQGKGEVVRNPLDIVLYLFYFPQIMAGPIQRWSSFQNNIKAIKRFDFDQFYQGFKLMLLGVFKKMVVADRIAFYVNDVFETPEQKGLHLVFAAYFYAIQIYVDFSGYTDIANGLSKSFGYSEVKNFSFPYFTRSISEFWQNWHITFSSWLRDYLFLPISFYVSRHLKKASYLGVKADYLIYSGASMVTMLIAGFWHGTSWTFVFWGLLFGVYLSVGQVSRKPRARLRKKIFGTDNFLKKGISIWINFNLLTFAWIFFRSLSLPDAFKFISSINLTLPDFAGGYIVLNFLLVVILVTVDLVQKSTPKFIRDCPLILKSIALALAVCLIILFSVDSASEFIYLRF